MSQTVIVDYGLGNLGSVSRALRWLGDEPLVTDDPAEINAAARVILPGDGAFGYGMQQLEQRGLVRPLLDHIEAGRPFLGICVGMQLLLTESEEFGHHRGLGVIPGRVAAYPRREGVKVPHIGWAALSPAAGRPWAGGLLRDVSPGEQVYFVHSYLALPDRGEHRVADAVYGGESICAVITRDNVTGCQFHPEKSGPVGLRILRTFLQSQSQAASTPAGHQGVPST